jgi:hypothetical protein
MPARVVSGGVGGLSRAALREAIALAVHIEDVDVVRQSEPPRVSERLFYSKPCPGTLDQLSDL